MKILQGTFNAWPTLPAGSVEGSAERRMPAHQSFGLADTPPYQLRQPQDRRPLDGASPSTPPALPQAWAQLVQQAALAVPRNRCATVVLTGGPCGGKTTALAVLGEALTVGGYASEVAEEAATRYVRDFGPFPPGGEAQVRWQVGMVRLQESLEDAALQRAQKSTKAALVLCDRGVRDAVGFVTDAADRRAFFEACGADEATFGAGRYDLVLHLTTAALGARAYYNYNKQEAQALDLSVDDGCNAPCNNLSRHTTPDASAAIDLNLQQAWSAHPHRIVLHNDGVDFAKKLRQVQAIVLTFMQHVERARLNDVAPFIERVAI